MTSPMTDKLNALVADYIKARNDLEPGVPSKAAFALADFCAEVFEKPFVATADDGRDCQVPHKSSQDSYRNTWNAEGLDVDCHSLKLIVATVGHTWHGGFGRNARP